MLRAGVILDGIVILLTTGVAYLLIRLVWPLLLG
jgi:sodium-dependent dicarboxylate transporter 2/3/5